MDASRYVELFQHFTKIQFLGDGFPDYTFNSSGQIILPTQGMGFFFGYHLDLIEYLMCKMNLKINLVQGNCDQQINSSHLCLAAYNLTEEQAKSTANYPLNQYYHLLLLSISKCDQDNTFLPYIKLFTAKTWILIISTILMFNVILKIINKQQAGFSNTLLDFVGFFLGQPSRIFEKIIKMKQTTIIMLFIWLLSFSILTKCFNSLLLKTFFKTSPSLTVETLEDLVYDPGIKIIGREALPEIKSFKPEIYEILEKRLFKSAIHFDIISKSTLDAVAMPQVINEIVERKAVLIGDSQAIGSTKAIYFNINLMESEHRYCYQMFFTYVSKSHPNYRQIFRILQTLIENGAHNQWVKILNIMTKFYVQTDFGDFDNNARKILDLDNEISLAMFYRGSIFGLLVGYLASIISLLLENIWKFIRNELKLSK